MTNMMKMKKNVIISNIYFRKSVFPCVCMFGYGRPNHKCFWAKVVISQAGHINSGAFEDFVAISQLAQQQNAWVHVDGAFGLWARVLPEKQSLTHGPELADS